MLYDPIFVYVLTILLLASFVNWYALLDLLKDHNLHTKFVPLPLFQFQFSCSNEGIDMETFP